MSISHLRTLIWIKKFNISTFLFSGILLLTNCNGTTNSSSSSNPLNSKKSLTHQSDCLEKGGICAPSRIELLVNEPNHVYQRPDIFPTYNGGEPELNKLIEKTMVYPKWEKENHIEGRVVVEFIIEKNGEITNPKILRVPKGSKNLGKETLRIISVMPKWKAGVLSGKKVRVSYIIPVLFRLE